MNKQQPICEGRPEPVTTHSAWVISSNDERFEYTNFSTKEEAIAEGTKYYDGEPFYVGELVNPPQPEDFFDCRDWLEKVSCQDDYMGEHAEDWDCSTNEQANELNEEVRKILSVWLDRHKLRPTFFNVENSERIEPNAACHVMEPVEPRMVLLERGKEFRFNDHVCIEMVLGVPLEKRTGRLVQVRKGCGQFGSNIYFVRLRDGSLATFENALIRHVDDEQFVDSFYRMNGKEAPVIPEQSPYEIDSTAATYSIGGKWPETGFVVDTPKQPETHGSFAMTISSPDEEAAVGNTVQDTPKQKPN